MTRNQKIFADEYTIDRNGARAYKVAYPRVKKASVAEAAASRLLRNVKVSEYIDTRLVRISEKAEIRAEHVLKEEGSIAFSDIRQLYDEDGELAPLNHLPENVARAIASVEIKERILSFKDEEQVLERVYRYKFWDKGRSLERLGKHLGMFKDTLSVNNTANVNLVEIRWQEE